MGIFSFTRARKESLDKGLEKTKESVFSKLSRAIVGKTKVDEEVLDNLEEVLISSDVGVSTTVRIILHPFIQCLILISEKSFHIITPTRLENLEAFQILTDYGTENWEQATSNKIRSLGRRTNRAILP